MADKVQEAQSDDRKIAIQAYFDAKSAAEKAAVVQKYPLLKSIFSEINHQS